MSDSVSRDNSISKQLRSAAATRGAERFTFIDGLRGLAALAVVFYHLIYNTELASTLVAVLPDFISFAAFHGSLGVKVFFVISGFVIAYSLRATAMTAGEVGSFVVRRQLRLDPPYWCVLFIVILQSVVGGLIPSAVERPLPTAGEVAMSAFYLHKITASRELLGVAWTLCIEIQYYVSFVALLLLAAIGTTDRRPRLTASCLLAVITGVASASLKPGFTWFGPYWHYFTAGALCVWALQSRSRVALVSLIVHSVGVAVVAHFRSHADAGIATGLITVWTIYGLGRANQLTTALRQAPFQYFGRVSYSLYLVHLPVLMVVMQCGMKLTGHRPGFAVMWSLLAFAACLIAADVFYRAVERPSVRFAASFKRAAAEVPPETSLPLMPPSRDRTIDEPPARRVA